MYRLFFLFFKQTLTGSSTRAGSGVYAYLRGSGWLRSRVSAIWGTRLKVR